MYTWPGLVLTQLLCKSNDGKRALGTLSWTVDPLPAKSLLLHMYYYYYSSSDVLKSGAVPPDSQPIAVAGSIRRTPTKYGEEKAKSPPTCLLIISGNLSSVKTDPCGSDWHWDLLQLRLIQLGL